MMYTADDLKAMKWMNLQRVATDVGVKATGSKRADLEAAIMAAQVDDPSADDKGEPYAGQEARQPVEVAFDAAEPEPVLDEKAALKRDAERFGTAPLMQLKTKIEPDAAIPPDVMVPSKPLPVLDAGEERMALNPAVRVLMGENQVTAFMFEVVREGGRVMYRCTRPEFPGMSCLCRADQLYVM